LNSLNGTFVGESRIDEAVLKPGDSLTVGPLTFSVVFERQGQIAQLPPLQTIGESDFTAPVALEEISPA
jgi:hypothetical protein